MIVSRKREREREITKTYSLYHTRIIGLALLTPFFVDSGHHEYTTLSLTFFAPLHFRVRSVMVTLGNGFTLNLRIQF